MNVFGLANDRQSMIQTLLPAYEEEWVALTDKQPTLDVRSDFVRVC